MSQAGSDQNEDYKLDEQVGYLLRLANQRHTTIFQAKTLDGLTPTQFSALVRISEQGKCSQNHLGRLAAMDVATIKGVVDRLNRRGLLVTEPDPGDKRRTLISLSEAGTDLLARMLPEARRITAETLGPLTKSEQRTLLRLLKKLA